MVEIEQSAQTLPPLNVGGQAHRRWRSLQELVVESLVVSLAMVVFDVLAHEETQVPFAEGDDATETLLFHRADEPLGIIVRKPLRRVPHDHVSFKESAKPLPRRRKVSRKRERLRPDISTLIGHRQRDRADIRREYRTNQ